MSLLEEQLEEIKRKTAGAGVTPDMVLVAGAQADPVAEDSLLPVPMSPIEKMMERDGKGKTMAKMLLGGFTGMTPFLMPELIGGKARYEQELKDYAKQQGLLNTQKAAAEYEAMLYDDDPSNDIKALQMGAIHQPDIYGPVLRDSMQNQFNPSASELPDATRAVVHYQDSLNRYVDENTGEVMMRQPGEEGYVKFADAFDRYKNREVGGLREQAAAKAGGAEEGKLDANEAAKNEAQKPQMEVAYDLVSSILDDPNKTYHNAYGVIDAMTPTVRQETADVESKIQQIGDILYMFARGELKGQGQVTEQEAEAARNAASRITNMRMGESEAEDELRRLQKMFGQRIGSSGQGGQSSGPPSYSQFEEDARARGITDPVMISAKYKELYGG